MIETFVIKTGGVETECVVFGKGPRTALLLPGLYAKSFFPLAAAIEERYKIFLDDFTFYLLDRPLNPPKNSSAEKLTDLAISALDYLKIKDAFIIGISAGGMAAQIIASKRSDLAKKMFLGSSAVKTKESAAALFKSWADMALCGNADGLNNSFAASVYSQDFFQKYKAQILSSLQGVGSEQLRRFAILSKAFADFDAVDLLPKIKCPIFATGADGDKIFGPSASLEIAKAAACDSYVYKGFGHGVYDEASDYPKRIYDFFMK